MISIGIDVHKNRYVATIKHKSRENLEQSSFENTASGIAGFIIHVNEADPLGDRSAMHTLAMGGKMRHDRQENTVEYRREGAHSTTDTRS